MGKIETEIDGLYLFPLKVFSDERGAVFHHLRSDSENYKTFGEVYFSKTNVGVIKGWKRHKLIEQNFVVPVGNMKFTFIDLRENSKSYKKRMSVIIGLDNYQRINVPPMIWYAFTPVGNDYALIANCTTMPHSPDESETLALDAFEF